MTNKQIAALLTLITLQNMPLVDASLRNAAVLVSCLEDEIADRLLGLVGPMQASRIRDAMTVLGTVSRSERDRVMRAFLIATQVPSEAPAPPSAISAMGAGGVEVDEGLARQFAPTREPPLSFKAIALNDAPQTPFGFLLETEADVVAPFLARESPQTVAVVLSYLRRSQAATLLKHLEPSFQAQVLGRLARLEDIDPACIDVVAEELRAWIERPHAAAGASLGGDALLREMLSSGRASDRAELIAALEREAGLDARQPSVAEPGQSPGGNSDISNQAGQHVSRYEQPTIGQRTARAEESRASRDTHGRQLPLESRRSLPFDQLVNLTEEALRRTIESSPREVLVLALVGADERLIRRITKSVSRREAKQFKRSLHLDAPTRLGDIEAAKHRISQIATQVVNGASPLSLVIGKKAPPPMTNDH